MSCINIKAKNKTLLENANNRNASETRMTSLGLTFVPEVLIFIIAAVEASDFRTLVIMTRLNDPIKLTYGLL